MECHVTSDIPFFDNSQMAFSQKKKALLFLCNATFFLFFMLQNSILSKSFAFFIQRGCSIMNKKQLLEQNFYSFLENYTADLLLEYIKTDERFSSLQSQKRAVAKNLKKQSELFFTYEELQNQYVQLVAECFYMEGLQDIVLIRDFLKEYKKK